jgi:hypothetical protein
MRNSIINVALIAMLVVSLFSMAEAKKKKEKSPLKEPTTAAAPASVLASTTAPVSVTGLAYKVEIDTRTNLDKLTDTNWIIRRNAVIFLGAERKTKNIAYLVNMLNDGVPAVRGAAINSLVKSCTTKNTKITVVQSILDRFDSEKDMTTQIDYIKALGKLKSKKTVAKLKLLLKHPYPLIRTYAIRSLGGMADATVYPLFVKMLVNEAESVRIQSAEVVARLKIKSAVPNLLANLKHPVGKVRKTAVYALGELGNRGVLPQLEEMFNDKDKYVVKMTSSAIKKIKKKYPPPEE